MTEFTIVYLACGKLRKTRWVAKTAENALELFKIWHKGIKVVDIV